jgi:hypothetical protein
MDDQAAIERCQAGNVNAFAGRRTVPGRSDGTRWPYWQIGKMLRTPCRRPSSKPSGRYGGSGRAVLSVVLHDPASLLFQDRRTASSGVGESDPPLEILASASTKRVNGKCGCWSSIGALCRRRPRVDHAETLTACRNRRWPATGNPPGTVMSRLYHARQCLRRGQPSLREL